MEHNQEILLSMYVTMVSYMSEHVVKTLNGVVVLAPTVVSRMHYISCRKCVTR